MKRSRFAESQIVAIMKEAETGTSIEEICRIHGISRSCYYQGKTKYGGLEEAELKRLKALEAENAQLKRMYADLSLKYEALKEIIEKNYNGGGNEGVGGVLDGAILDERTQSL